jgi:hypothetical protein
LTEGTAVSKGTDSTATEEKPQQETASGGAEAETGDIGALTEPFKIRKRIGSTDYEAEVYFNFESSETLNDKILRLIRNEAGREQT